MQPPLHLDTVVPDGQRMTRVIRDFMVQHVGPTFRFDATMREFFAHPGGRTLGDAVDLWQASRDQRPEIAGQFEYNRFTREYWATHPDGTRQNLREEWKRYKELPASQRVPGASARSARNPG